jgi:hypothetical protein
MKIIFLLIAVFALLPQLSFATFATFYVSVIPLTALAYDERSKWDKFALTMPYTRSQIVISKYILGIISIAITALLVLIGDYINTGSFMNQTDLKEFLLVFCIAILITSLLLPAMFKFGVEKGRILFIFIAVIFSGLMVFLSSDDMPAFNKVSFITEHYFYLVPIITVVVLLLSVLISVSVYMKKSF